MRSNHQPSNENHNENWRSLDANEITEELVSWHRNGNIILLPSVDAARHSSRFSGVHLAQSFARSTLGAKRMSPVLIFGKILRRVYLLKNILALATEHAQ
jgi:hypothetical protein